MRPIPKSDPSASEYKMTDGSPKEGYNPVRHYVWVAASKELHFPV
jgi:hypothetical protein